MLDYIEARFHDFIEEAASLPPDKLNLYLLFIIMAGGAAVCLHFYLTSKGKSPKAAAQWAGWFFFILGLLGSILIFGRIVGVIAAIL